MRGASAAAVLAALIALAVTRADAGTVTVGAAVPSSLPGAPGAAEPAGPDPQLVAAVIGRAADQVRRCYRSPRVPHEARQIVTVLLVRYGADGMLTATPQIAAQRGIGPDTLPYAAAMAQAAIAAVMRCVPLSLPTEYHGGGWDEFELTFSPRGLA